MSREQNILARLVSLEEKDEARVKEIKKLKDNIFTLQKENCDFKKELFIIQNENDKLKEKIGTMERQMTHLLQDMPTPVKKSLTPDSKTGKTDNLESRISAVEEQTRRLKKSSKTITQNTTTLNTKVDTVQSTVNQLSGLQKVLNKTLVDRQHGLGLDKEVETLKRRTKSIETRQGNIFRSFTCVELNREGHLVKDRSLKLETCVDVHVDSDMFDRTSCCLVPQCDGEFVVGVQFCQWDEGEVFVRLKGDGGMRSRGHHMGRTVGYNDIGFGMVCLSLKKGQKLWLEANRLDGNISQSFTCVHLTKEGQLVHGQWIKLDKCLFRMRTHIGMFDPTTCCLVPQFDGDYAVGVFYEQDGGGVVAMGLDWDGSGGSGDFIGRTAFNYDVSCGVTCLSLKKGQKVWVQAMTCGGGQASIHSCRFMCWLIG